MLIAASEWLRQAVLGLRWWILRVVAGRMVVGINLTLIDGTITWRADQSGYLLNVHTRWTGAVPERLGLHLAPSIKETT